MAKKSDIPTNVEETAQVISEDTYPVAELVAESRAVFGVPQECVVAALKPLNKETMTVSEARAVIEKFMKKEVK